MAMFTPERGRGRQDGFAGHSCVHGQDCPLMWVLGSLTLGCSSGQAGATGRQWPGRGGPLLMQGTGLVSLPWSWEGGERGKTGDSEAVSSFSGAWVAVEEQVLVFAGKLNGHHERMLRIKAVTPAATSCTLLCTKQCYQLFASYGPSSTGQWRR